VGKGWKLPLPAAESEELLKRPILLLLLTLFLLGLGSSAFGQCTGHAVLNDYERGAFLNAAYGERAVLAVELLAAEGCTQAMLDSLHGIGVTVRFADEKTGYALVMMPKSKVLDALDLPGISYVSVAIADPTYSNFYQKPSPFVPPSERKAMPVPPITIPFPRVATTLAPNGPYFAAKEAGLTLFWQQHSEADGRGVRVAVLDRGLDLLHPALQVAKDRNGNTVPKVVDVLTVTTPEEDTGWLQFGDPIQTTNGAFFAAGRTWTAPRDGSFRFGIFTRELHLGSWDPTKTDPHLKSVLLSVGVLWDEQSNRVWVDTDGDGNFGNQRALGDYGETHEVDYFGRKNGQDDHRIPFGVKIDRARHAAYLSIADSPHGAMVSGPLAANRLTGGLFDGAAPNAQLIDARIPALSVRTSLMLRAFACPDVDIINSSGRLGVPDDEGREDFLRHVVERAIRIYDKPVACYCGAPSALHVLDYQSPEMLRRNRQLPPPYREAINGGVWFVADGLVNTVLAPSASLVTQSRYMPVAVPWEDGRLHVVDIVVEPPAPAGYGIGANPSPTIPVVSGILADLISEAKRTQVRYSAVRLTQAILTGARSVPGFPASKQGFGLANASGAWEQLAKMATADDPKNPVLTSFTVARMQDGRRREVNGFRADLPKVSGTLRGELWITRRGGYSDGRAYTLGLRSDDGTYRLFDQRATLVRDRPARVRFSAKITPGLHVAFLQLLDTKAGVVMQEIPLSVRAPDVPETVAPGVEEYETAIAPLRSDMRYVRLGEDTQAARFVMRIPYEGPSLISARSMPGFVYGVLGNRFVSTEKPPGQSVDAAHHVGPIEEFESLVLNAKPGTQTIFWENRGRPEYATPYDPPAPDVPVHGTVVVTKYAVGFTEPDSRTVQLTNKLAEIEGKVEFYAAAMGSSMLTGAGAHSLATLDRSLPVHLSQWRVRVSTTVDGLGPVDAFLLNCTGKSGCVVAAQQLVTAKGATLIVDNPTEGSWRIVIRARDRLGHPASYRVQEASLTPTGDTSEAVKKKLSSGALWLIPQPAKKSDALYVAFRIAGTPGRQDHKDGLRIAMTALDVGGPRSMQARTRADLLGKP
jgi:hypothetical protein